MRKHNIDPGVRYLQGMKKELGIQKTWIHFLAGKAVTPPFLPAMGNRGS